MCRSVCRRVARCRPSGLESRAASTSRPGGADPMSTECLHPRDPLRSKYCVATPRIAGPLGGWTTVDTGNSILANPGNCPRASRADRTSGSLRCRLRRRAKGPNSVAGAHVAHVIFTRLMILATVGAGIVGCFRRPGCIDDAAHQPAERRSPCPRLDARLAVAPERCVPARDGRVIGVTAGSGKH